MAMYIGSQVGAQIPLFAQPPRTVATSKDARRTGGEAMPLFLTAEPTEVVRVAPNRGRSVWSISGWSCSTPPCSHVS